MWYSPKFWLSHHCVYPYRLCLGNDQIFVSLLNGRKSVWVKTSVIWFLYSPCKWNDPGASCRKFQQKIYFYNRTLKPIWASLPLELQFKNSRGASLSWPHLLWCYKSKIILKTVWIISRALICCYCHLFMNNTPPPPPPQQLSPKKEEEGNYLYRSWFSSFLHERCQVLVKEKIA